MQYDVNNGLLQVVIDGEEINAVVGEAAQIDVGEAINYIQSGKAEIEEAVEEGITQFNENATEKTNEFDLNAQNKTSDFNANATQKTLDFNSNASDKTSDFNLNAQNKTSDFNDNYTEKKGLIDAQVVIAEGAATTATNQAGLAKQWAIGDPSEPVGNSSKYWAEYAESIAQTIGDPANKDLSNLSTTGNNRFVNLQQQIDAIVASSDVFDIVGTYAELQAYDITTVPVNDIIKVLVDSTHSGAATYYRCIETAGVKSWSYIGSEGAYYTKGEADGKFSTIPATGSSLDYTGTTLSLENAQGTVLSSVTIKSTPDLDNTTISLNSSSELQAIGTVNKNTATGATNSVYDWVGTLQEYIDQNVAVAHPTWICYITDDVQGGITVYTKNQVNNLLSTKANSADVYTKSETDTALSAAISTMLGNIYPVGSIYIGTTSTCPIASLISGSTWTIVSSDRVLQGSSSSHTAGSTVEAGLPNITGTIGDRIESSNDPTATGAFYVTSTAGGGEGSGNYRYFGMGINASRSSSIYGNSTTVQPPAYVVNIWQRTA